MSKLLSVTAPLLFMLSAGCASPDESPARLVENAFEGRLQTSPISLEVDRVFGAEEEPQAAVLSRIRDVEVDPAGRVFVLGADRLVSFDTDGSLRWEMNRQGEGPGELSRSSRIALHPSGDIYVDNQFGTRYEVYTPHGEYIRTVPVNTLGHNRISLVGFVNDSMAVGHRAESGLLGTTVMVLNTGEEWSVRDQFTVDQEEGSEIPEFLTREPDIELVGGHITMTNVVRYEVSVLTLQGDTVRVVRRDAPDYMRPGAATLGTGQRGTALFSSLSGPVRLAAGYHLTSGYWPTNISDPDEAATLAFTGNAPPADFYRTLDVFDADWQLLYSIDEDAFEDLGIEQVAVTSDGDHVYSMEIDPYPRVVRYRVIDGQ